ncbi:MAG TPA: response regulator transcription factor [Trueperaceae bacterium]|nr:response regulator transcription factor [Trueperaceae bacterium]
MRVLIADDHPLFRMGLSMALGLEGFEVAGEVENGRQAVERCRQGGVDVVLMDVKMADMDGIEACGRIRGGEPTNRDPGTGGAAEDASRDPAAPSRPLVVMLTTFEEPALQRAARQAGATAFLSKETAPRELARLLRAILEDPGRDWMPRVELPELTPREAQVLRLMAQGLSNKGIAKELGLSPETVKDYLLGAFRKLGVRDRVSAARRAGELGML